MKEEYPGFKPSTVNSLGYPVFSDCLSRIPRHKKLLINTINQYSYCMAEKDETFKEALQNSDILLPDGVGMVAAVRLMEGEKVSKIAGAELNEHLLQELNETGGSCFYLGASGNTLQKIKEKLAIEFPFIKVGVYSPPYKTQFSRSESQAMIAAVNEFKPDVLFIGMTAPKQEKWAHQHKDELDAKIICSIGAVFDFYAGTIDRPGQMWIDMGLEWLGRLLKEPKRMWKRYLYYGPVFVHLIMKEKVKRQLELVRVRV